MEANHSRNEDDAFFLLPFLIVPQDLLFLANCQLVSTKGRKKLIDNSNQCILAGNII